MATAPERIRKIADDLHQLTKGLRDTGILLSLLAAREGLRELAAELETADRDASDHTDSTSGPKR